MQFEHLWIDAYKNLRNCRMDWADPPPYLNAIIGTNGSGKSNLIEAILHILIGVYLGRTPPFAFTCRYRTQGRLIELRSEPEHPEAITAVVDGQLIGLDQFRAGLRNGHGQVYYPELTFVSYSGTCERVSELIEAYRQHFRKITSHPDADSLAPLFLCSSTDQAQRILLALYSHRRLTLLSRLQVARVSGIRISVRSPAYFDPAVHEPQLWGTSGAVRRVLAALNDCADSVDSQRRAKSRRPVDQQVQTTLFDVDDEELYQETRTYRFADEGYKGSIHSLADRLAKAQGDNLYLALEHLAARHLLVSVDYQIHGQQSAPFPFDHLSEGEKQLLAVIGAVTLTTQRHNLLLLDEPDTHLNPQWLWEYPDLLTEPLHDRQRRCSTVLMATHDPVLISGLLRNQVWLAKPDADGRTTLTHPRRDPRGQGVANLLSSPEFFGLPSSLDKHSQALLDRRLALSVKPTLNDKDKTELSSLNQQLQFLQPGISERDPNYAEFLRQKFARQDG